MKSSKPIWSEGMFMRPQHFQQADRYADAQRNLAREYLHQFGWGIHQLVVDVDLLAQGKYALQELHAIFPDGTLVRLPHDADAPGPRDIGRDHEGKLIYLAVGARRGDQQDTNMENGSVYAGRYVRKFQALRDATQEGGEAMEIAVAELDLRIAFEGEPLEDFILLPLARVGSINADGSVLLAKDYFPPALSLSAHDGFLAMVAEITSLLRRRGEQLAQDVDPSRAQGVSDLLDFNLLQAVNSHEPFFRQLSATTDFHPFVLYMRMMDMAAELAIYLPGHRLTEYQSYKHDDPYPSMARALELLRQELSVVVDRKALQLDLEARGGNLQVHVVEDRSLIQSAQFVLVVQADVPRRELINNIPNMIKVAPAEKIRDLVSVQLPGILLQPMPVAPRQLPYYSNAAYFELSQEGEFWAEMEASVAFAFHVSGTYPGLTLEFWAVRSA